MILVVLSCDVCGKYCCIGYDADDATDNLIQEGGRVIAGLRVCSTCSRSTR